MAAQPCDDQTMSASDAKNPAFQQPLQLCRPSKNHLYLEPVPETLEILKSVKSAVSVVSGVGPQRLGKSTILNLFHSRKTSGFGLGHTLDAQTTGKTQWSHISLHFRPKPTAEPSLGVLLCLQEYGSGFGGTRATRIWLEFNKTPQAFFAGALG
jgi:hypothetical protein